MESKILPTKGIPQKIIDEITDILKEKATDNWRSQSMRKTVVIENLMVRAYANNPSASYSECRKAIQPFCQEYHLEDTLIARHAEEMYLKNIKVREDLFEWAYGVANLIYDGMAGDVKSLKEAKALLEKPYSAKRDKTHTAQERAVMFSMFEFIPELRKTKMRNDILFIGIKFITVYLKKIIDTLIVDFESQSEDISFGSIDELKREIFLARNELAEYKALVEAEDAEYDDKIEELKQQEISAFFAALNNEKYGFIIDTVFLLNRACNELKKEKKELPFSVQGVPALLDRILKFFKDSGIAPISKFAPHSEQMLTLAQMEGCKFEPVVTRNKAIADDENVKVKVLSSGWKYGDTIISMPVLHEIED